MGGSQLKQDIKKYEEYCAGCGLCHSVNNIPFTYINGFFKPILKESDLNFCEQICPAGGKHIYRLDPKLPWGRYENVYCSWSTDKKIRYTASSGGTLTALAVFLLNNNIVDGIIHTKVSKDSVIDTQYTVSYTIDDVVSRSGSRYTASSPLINLLGAIEEGKKYAFIGKPCDVIALNNYTQSQKFNQPIVLTMSFFCAGEPSRKANKKLLDCLGTSEKTCRKLIYRGNGWPGYATALDENNTSKRMTYNESWGSILGRDINHYCKFCMDGIGEFADIACGDAWYMNADGTPDFSEHDGRNVTFARTKAGQNILDQAYKAGILNLSSYDINELKFIQNYQYERRTHVYSRILGMRICGHNVPNYPMKIIKAYSDKLTLMQKLRISFGTVKRVWKGNM